MKSGKFLEKKPELVAPAGDRESLKIAVEQGADAVYLGLKEFNARRQARNFSLSELKEAVEFAHLRGAKIYLAFNTLLFPSEIEKALKLLIAAWNTGIDAVLLQDWGLINLVASFYPGIRIHLSTQVDIHNLLQLELLKKITPIKRVVLARELSLDEIKKFKKSTDLEFEVFIHGALCCSYSGLCLFSSLVGGRSGNRGLCAQPCRLPYKLISKENKGSIPLQVRESKHYLSLKDLATVSLLPQLIEAGVEAFKIEGRLKSSYYVGVVTGVYRRAIDRYLENPEEYQVTAEEINWLEEAYSRGFTEGHLFSLKGRKLLSLTRPSHRGVFLGRVKHINHLTGELIINLRKPLQIGDEVEVWVKGGKKVKQKVTRMLVDDIERDEIDSGEVKLFFADDRHLISVGDRIFKVRSARETEVVELARERKPKKVIQLSGRLAVINGKYPELRVYFAGREFVFEGKSKVETGKKVFLTEEKAKNKLNSFGTLPFYFSELQVEISSNAYLPLASLGELRRQVEAMLKESILKKYERQSLELVSLPSVKQANKRKAKKEKALLTTRVRNRAQALAALETEVNRVAFDVSIWEGNWQRDLSLLFKAVGEKELGLVIPPVVREKDINFWKELIQIFKPYNPFIICGEIGLASFLFKSNHRVVFDYHLNIANAYFPFNNFNKGSLTLAVPSLELSLLELSQLNKSCSAILEPVIYGWPRVMISESCFFLALDKNCQKQCRKTKYNLKDKAGYEFPLEFDHFCRLNLYNSRPFYLISSLDSLWKAGFSHFQLLFLREEASDVKRVCSLAAEAVNRLKKGLLPDRKNPAFYTTGHYFRRVF